MEVFCLECSDAHLIGLVVTVLEEVPQEGEDLSRALVVHVPHTSYAQYDCLMEGGRREREMEGRGGRGREGRGEEVVREGGGREKKGGGPGNSIRGNSKEKRLCCTQDS